MNQKEYCAKLGDLLTIFQLVEFGMRQYIAAKEGEVLGMTMFLAGQIEDPPDAYLKLATLANVIEKFEKLSKETVSRRLLDVRNAIAHGAVRPAPGNQNGMFPLELANIKSGKIVFRKVLDDNWFNELAIELDALRQKTMDLTEAEAPGFWALSR